jgi:hypothetical protein
LAAFEARFDTAVSLGKVRRALVRTEQHSTA